MIIEKMEPMKQEEDGGMINPFIQECELMGTFIGKNVAVMMTNHETEECKFIHVIDLKTGERIRIKF